MLKQALVALALLTGCRAKQAAVPTEPGTSIPLKYPVVLVGQKSAHVRDDLPTLISATVASGMNFLERKIVDSSGAIYEVKTATTVGNTTAWWRDLGTSQQRYYLELKAGGQGLEQAQRLVLEQSPKAPRFSSIAELIEGCRRSWEWAR